MNLFKLSVLFLATITSINLSAQLSSNELSFVELTEAIEPGLVKNKAAVINYTSTFSDIKQQLSYKIDYPASMRPYEIEGVSTLKVTISENGSIENYEITESLGTAFDKEIKNTLDRVNKVSPVLFNGVPTKQTIVFPIQFRL